MLYIKAQLVMFIFWCPMCPKAWSEKRERQYQKIKKSAKARGKTDDRAEEIAARTVNKTRRLNNETKSGRKTTTGTGNPNSKLAERSKQELYNLAKKRGISGRSNMRKEELIMALQ